MAFNLNWRTRAKSYMQPMLCDLPKTSNALFKGIVKGSGKLYKAADLIRCKNCYLNVHKICYGAHIDINIPWTCDRCENKSSIIVSNINK